MKLEEYIKDTLVQIVNGVQQANEELTKKGAFIPSENVRYWGNGNYAGLATDDEEGNPHLVRDVDFDIAISVNDHSKNGGEAGIEVFSAIKIGAGTSKEAGTSSIKQ